MPTPANNSNTVFRMEDYFSPALMKIMQRYQQFEEKTGQVNKKVTAVYDNMSKRVENFKIKNIEAINDLKDEIPGLERAIKIMTNPIVAVAAATLAIGTGLYKSGQMASDFQSGMAKANVTAQLMPPELRKISSEILEIGRTARSNTGLAQVPQVFERIISAGLDVNTTMRTLKPTLEAAKAGFADVDVTASAAVSVMNSSGVMNAVKVYDILFATLNKGNAQFVDIATYLPKIIPMARNVGFELQETAGAYAFLTAQGQTAERASRLLTNVFQSLASPDRIKDFNALGIALFNKQGKRLPLLDVVEQLDKKLQGLTDKKRTAVLGSLGLDIEASTGFAAMTQNLEKLRSIIDFTTNSQGQLDLAVKNASTPMDSYYRVQQNLGAIMIRLGNNILPIFERAMNKVNNLLEFTIKYGKPVLDFFRGMWLVIGPVIQLLWFLLKPILAITAAVIALNIAAALNPFLWIPIAVGALYALYQNTEKIRAVMDGIWAIGKAIGAVFKGLGTIIAGVFMGNLGMIKTGLSDTVAAVKNITDKGLGNIYNSAYYKSLNESKQKALEETLKKREQKMMEKGLNPDGSARSLVPGGDEDNARSGASASIADSLGSSTGGTSGGGVRNVNVTIQKLVEKIEVHMENGKMSVREVEEIIKEVLIKTVRNAELSIGSQ